MESVDDAMIGHGVAWQIGGTAGEGLESGGEIFSLALAATGHRPTTQRDFPSRIRGGDTTFTVRLTPEGYLAPPSHVDVALAFNATVVPRMAARLVPSSLLLIDEGKAPASLATEAEVAEVPFSALAAEAGLPRAKNMVALGVSAALLDIPIDALADAVAERFASKGAEVMAANRRAVVAGHAHGAERFGVRFPVQAVSDAPALFLSGNEAASLGALAAGCRVAAAYPITPASEVLEYLTPRLHELGGVALQMEDEMAALNVCAGAGFVGGKALTATSGPGLSLMTETMGMTGSMEIPVVIFDCQRPGPSTGMPTKHGQEDLWHIIHGGHGEFVRVAMAPVDVEDAFHAAAELFRIAEQFRCPAILALDQQACMFKQTVSPFDLDAEAHRQGVRAVAKTDGTAWENTFHAYADGPRALPGGDGMHYANSTEHGPNGFTTEDPKTRIAMVDRRLRIMDDIVQNVRDPVLVDGDGDITLLSWGSTVGACQEAAARSKNVRVVSVRLLWPFPRAQVEAALGKGPIYVVEANAFGQMARLVKSELPIHDRCHSVLRYDGIPVTSDDILSAMEGA